jgi:tripartite-type tricarboxylate transporter receptor subunit TctC
VIVAKAGQFGNFKNFLASAQNNPGKINFASAGIGTGMHFLGELLNANANINIKYRVVMIATSLVINFKVGNISPSST